MLKIENSLQQESHSIEWLFLLDSTKILSLSLTHLATMSVLFYLPFFNSTQKNMKQKYFIYLIFFIIWSIASGYIAWQGQFVSSYLESYGVMQREFNYPTDGVLFCIFAYGFVCINYVVLFTFEESIKNPFISYLLSTIIPAFLTLLAVLGAMHASSHWGAFIVIMLLTFLLHFLLLPVLLGVYHKRFLGTQTTA